VNIYLKILFLLFVLSFFCLPHANSQRYNIDQGPKKKVQIVSFKKIFKKKDPAQKQSRKDEKKLRRSARYEKKAIKKYWKTYDHPKEVKSDQRVYKRMKKNLKKSDRINQGRHPDPWVTRIFKPKRETKRVSDKKPDKVKKVKKWKKKV